MMCPPVPQRAHPTACVLLPASASAPASLCGTALLAIVLLATLLLGACAQDEAARRREVQEISAHHAQDLAAFEAAQAAFARENPTPSRIDFPGVGTILLHECALAGRPGRADLWLRYTYVNTTGRPIEEIVVTIWIDDPAGDELDHGVDMPLQLPLSFRFSPDSSYTTSISVPTEGVHQRPGWSWTIRAQAVGMEQEPESKRGPAASRRPF